MRQLRNWAVAGAGIWAGEMVANLVTPMLPRGADGGVNPMLEKATRYLITGGVVVFSLKALGSRGKRG